MACGYDFIYDGTPSELYGVTLVFLDENYTHRPSGSGIEMITTTVRRNPTIIYLDAMQSPPLEFNIEIVSDDPSDIFKFTAIKDWLGGEISFKRLQICAEHFNTFYFNCYISLNEDLVFNGGYWGITGTVHCDAPWAWQFEEEKKYELNVGKSTDIIFDNLSQDTEMLRPIIEFTMGNSGAFSVTNNTTGKTTSFTELIDGETITLDNLYGIITSSTGLLRVSNFNKIFLKLAKGRNELTCNGNASNLTIRFTNAKRIGGAYY